MPNRVVHFEITAEQPERAAEFYRKIFNLGIKKFEGPKEYWLITTGKGSIGINGGMFKKMEHFSGYINIVDVASVDDTTKKIEANGGRQVTPKITIPGIGYTAYFNDTEGNVFGVIQEDTNAK